MTYEDLTLYVVERQLWMKIRSCVVVKVQCQDQPRPTTPAVASMLTILTLKFAAQVTCIK